MAQSRTKASTAARALAAMRKTYAGGRPRSDAPRCPCAKMTLKRAEARGKSAEHAASCSFYPQSPAA